MLVPTTSDFTLGNYLRKCEELHTNLHLITMKKHTNDVDKHTTTIKKVIMYHMP